MATGTFSGVKTGSDPSSRGAVKADNSPYSRITSYFQRLTCRQRLIALAVLLLVATAAALCTFCVKSSAYVTLYEGTRLSDDDARQICGKLGEMGVNYSMINGSGAIMVPPSSRNKARIELACFGLPHRPLDEIADSPMPLSSDEREQRRRVQLQNQLISSIRVIDGVCDAYVQISYPKNDGFSDEEKPSAAVMIKLCPGITLAPCQVKGISHLVAYSVPKLDPAKVEIVTTKGILLKTPDSDESSQAGTLSARQQELKIAYEQGLQKKVQNVLNRVLGPDRYAVAVDATLEMSSTRKETNRMGSPSDTAGSMVEKDKYEDESLTASEHEKQGSPQQMHLVKNPDGTQSYHKTNHTIIRKISQVREEKVTPPGELKKLTASVVVDNLKPEKTAQIQKLIEGAIGCDEGRGDYVNVASIPFNSQAYDSLRQDMEKASQINQKPSLSPHYAVYTSLAAMAVLVLAIMYLILSGKTEKTRPALMAGPAVPATACDISDLVASKQGSPDYMKDTRVHPSMRLERLAAEKPIRIAELLKSTWLSQ